jgi:hypothetical protein
MPPDLSELYLTFGIIAEKAQVMEMAAGNAALAYVTFFFDTSKITPAPGAIRPGSTLIEEVRFATVSPPEGDASNPRSPIYGEVAGPGRARHATHGANDRIVTRGERRIAEEGGLP